MEPPKPKPARQKRSEETLARILQGTMEALKDRDIETIGVDDIARASGLTTGALYSRFKGKDELLGFLLHSIQEKQLAELGRLLAREHWRGRPLAERIGWLVDQTRATGKAHPGVVRALIARQMKADAAGNAEAARKSAAVVDLLSEWLLACREEVRVEEPETAVRTMVCWLATSVHTAVLYPAIYPGVSEDEAVRHLKRAAIAYLGG
jgi:AcrR family transcriptional regulator